VRDMFRGFRAVFYKETLHVRRDFGTLFFSLIIPLLQMLLLGFGIDTNIRQINTVVFNADGRQESREWCLAAHPGVSSATDSCRGQAVCRPSIGHLIDALSQGSRW